jgi:hypothetical protein
VLLDEPIGIVQRLAVLGLPSLVLGSSHGVADAALARAAETDLQCLRLGDQGNVPAWGADGAFVWTPLPGALDRRQ